MKQFAGPSPIKQTCVKCGKELDYVYPIRNVTHADNFIMYRVEIVIYG